MYKVTMSAMLMVTQKECQSKVAFQFTFFIREKHLTTNFFCCLFHFHFSGIRWAIVCALQSMLDMDRHLHIFRYQNYFKWSIILFVKFYNFLFRPYDWQFDMIYNFQNSTKLFLAFSFSAWLLVWGKKPQV